MERSEWGKGPWELEPDRWEDRFFGLPVLAVREPDLGNWCGYVAVPPGHPWHGGAHDDLNPMVHGGLTYSGFCQGRICHVARPGEPENVFWVGFDCAHAGDLVPGLRLRSTRDTYRTLAYVQDQLRGLAAAASRAAQLPRGQLSLDLDEF